MARLHIISLTCRKTEDAEWDEIQIFVNDKSIWGSGFLRKHQFKAGLTRQINKWADFTSEYSVIKIYDVDEFSPDDLLGELNVHYTQRGSGRRTANFAMQGADYLLTYEVIH